MLYGRTESQTRIKSLGHYFNPSETLKDKIGLAGSSYELLNSIPTVVQYFGSDIKTAWAEIASHEQKLQGKLLEFLTSRSDVTIHGERRSDATIRVPTISFTVEGRTSQSVVVEVEKSSSLGIRWGHFFSYRLVTQRLGLSEDGVIRVSMVHYNTGMCY
jgi:selenocysteine lyase/cysteine desulfurase